MFSDYAVGGLEAETQSLSDKFHASPSTQRQNSEIPCQYLPIVWFLQEAGFP